MTGEGVRSEDVDRLRLIRTANVGPVTYRQLMARFGDAASAIEALPRLAQRGGGKGARIPPRDAISAEIEKTQRLGGKLLFLGDTAYPALLAEIDNAPPAISYRGDIDLVAKKCVAMVGARNSSASAVRFARQLAHECGEQELVVVSGLARGIDSAAHAGSLESGTIGVIAGGLDVAYPPQNRELQEQIAQRGLLLAEMPLGTEPRARHFPYRNRIIAGVSAGTVVIEAAPRSGSLITARLAGEFGREVMAVPGNPLDPRSRGCNGLIRDGATLVQNAEEIAEQLCGLDGRYVVSGTQPTPRLFEADAVASEDDYGANEKSRITDLLSADPVPVDEIVRQSGCPAPVVQAVLLELELAGKIERAAGAKVKLVL